MLITPVMLVFRDASGTLERYSVDTKSLTSLQILLQKSLDFLPVRHTLRQRFRCYPSTIYSPVPGRFTQIVFLDLGI